MVITTSPLVKTYTLEEFWKIPEPPDHSKLELIKGVLYMSPPPEEIHDEAASEINSFLRDAIRDGGYKGSIFVARAAIWLDDGTYLEPDLMYVSKEMKARMKGHRVCADLVVEVVSPSSAIYDRTTKADTYEAMGVGEMWIVDPKKRTIDVRYFKSGKRESFGVKDTIRSEVLPDLKIPVRRIFS